MSPLVWKAPTIGRGGKMQLDPSKNAMQKKCKDVKKKCAKKCCIKKPLAPAPAPAPA